MAALFASMAVKWAMDSLSSLLPTTRTPPPAAAASQEGLEDLRLLERTMRRIHATLHDAEQHWNVREESTKLRLKELKDLAYDAEDVVEEYEYEVNRTRVEALELAAAVQGAGAGGGGSSKRKRQEVNEEHFSVEAGIVPVPSDLAFRARKVIERFVEIKDYSESFSLSENDGERIPVPDIHSVRQTSSFVFAPKILGREQDKENVIEKLVPGEDGSAVGDTPMSVLAIVGMGGLGKTTLAQLVYNDTRISQSFDLRAWVCVSECFNVGSITRKIVDSLTMSSCDHITAGQLLQGALVDQITGKRLFLVLDDVWNERSDLWELLCMPMFASRQCVVLVTTRNMVVARLVQTMPSYNLNFLSPHESWSLFKQTAFVEKETVIAANLARIGRRITGKCKGLPLAIKALGSMLRYETDEMKWRDVLESELWDLEQSRNEVLPALELSYKCMPIHLKRCFVALSLCPKRDFYIDENRIVYLWKQLDLIQCDVSDMSDEIGISYVRELVQRSLLSYIDGQMFMHHGQMIMHDLVHDLVCFLAGEEFFRLEVDGSIGIPQDARYLSIAPPPQGDRKSIQIANASRSLRAIIMMGDTHVENPEALFLNCKKYRTIHVKRGNLAKASLDFMGGMKLLRYFTVIGYRNATPLVVPNSFFQLFNLREVDFGEDTVRRIGRLVNLHELPRIHISKCDCFYSGRELRNLNKLRKLCIYGLCNASISDANEARLYCKKNIQLLELHFNALECCEHKERADAGGTVASALLESLRPHHQNLIELTLTDFRCEVYPSWLGSASFSKLTKLWLFRFQAQHLPTLGELPSLKYLDVRGMGYVQQIGRKFCTLDPSVNGFRSLTCLKLSDTCRLSEWSGVENGDFPRLETLDIFSACELRSLPSSLFLSLRNLHLYDCRNLVTFPSSDTLQYLSVSACASLNEIPGLPSLQSLKLFNCPGLVTCAHFPLLTALHLDGPFKEEIVHKLVNSHLLLEQLYVSSDTIFSIDLDPRNLPRLVKLVLHCCNLEHCKGLDSLTSLKSLNVKWSPQLHIPDSLRRQFENLEPPEPI